MAKSQVRYVCQSCGAVYGKWAGHCDACGAWNTIAEETVPAAAFAPRAKGGAAAGGHKLDLEPLTGKGEPLPRRPTAIAELDRVTGGGLVPGSALLVGGDPGIGKSTLLLQAAAALARSGAVCVYVSGEEAVDQVRLRARRLGLADAPVALAAATSLSDILATLDTAKAPDVVVIDSIQTMFLDALDSAPGTVTQVRACSHELIRLA